MAATWLRETQKLEPIAVGHRVVHGGPGFDRPVLIDEDVLAELERYVSLAPLHQPNNLAPIRSHSRPLSRSCRRSPASTRPSIAATMRSPTTTRSPIALYDEGVRRYGFHGLSYEFVAEQSAAGGARDRGRARDRRPSGQRRVDVRALGRPQRREHDGLYRARRFADGHAAGPARPRRRALSDPGEADDRRRRFRTCSIANAA